MVQEKYPPPSSIRPEEEIKILEKRIEKINEAVENNGSEAKEDVIRNEIRYYLQEFQQSPDFTPLPSTHDEIEEIKNLEPTQQIGALISVVFKRGLAKAISLAQALDNPALLDEFHDTLIDRYYQVLIKKGIIK